MKKEIKKLESRQDVLDGWISKGAMFQGLCVKSVAITVSGSWVVKLGEVGMDTFHTVIYEILYSPESNFFEVMYGVSDAPRIVMKSKADCVNRKNPLDRILTTLNAINNLNETTS